ncbi:tRNA (adenosine(37)-N6)-threonylcarbamoyltransferase complex ATPase subunit type 1 TsaE [Salinicola rhizosphaerae]|uniref:tRNA threonylcarbamoyladenosine biosynthesis protein TsaE n=1 Tax=Salinicola rhizosphaerae TaxID=1443141 RepID=A0ABQ3E719_9GAMM|nr:tRNA (adenosine(37)-N6)-threonylcarbamoyltransferase complex ATPase subunit type 1 TsaE [Salinicola rhizosphaerae]GHB28214.1 tRNA (adenosine(37)-N6)-threonylcarbamoyltransferase complex ATPase subunit type 1 TsaE [Salinicola rhizosphaerae]
MPIFLDDETAQVTFGADLGHALEGRGQVHLIGELGAGKTTLTRGVLRAYGHEGAVKSPTYTLVEPYELGPHHIYHFDLYRLGDPEELEFMGARDMLSPEALSLIEWSSRGAGWLPQPDIELHLRLEGSGRQAWAVPHTEHGKAALSRLPASLREVPSDKDDAC